MKTAADWWRRTQLLLGSEKDTGRTLLGKDWTTEAPNALLLLMLMSVVLVMAVVVIFLLKLVMVVLLKMDPLVVVLLAVVGMLLGVMGLVK